MRSAISGRATGQGNRKVFGCVSGGTGADHARVLFEKMQSAPIVRGTQCFESYIRSRKRGGIRIREIPRQ